MSTGQEAVGLFCDGEIISRLAALAMPRRLCDLYGLKGKEGK